MANESDIALSADIKQASFDLNQIRTLGTKFTIDMADAFLLYNYVNEQKNGPDPARPVNFNKKDIRETEESESIEAELDFIARMENKLGKSIDDIDAEDARNEAFRLLRIKIGYIDLETDARRSYLDELRAVQQAANPGSV